MDTATLSLFNKPPFPEADWDRILALRDHGHPYTWIVFEELLRHEWVSSVRFKEIGGLSHTRRLSDLRDAGIKLVPRRLEGATYNEYSLPRGFREEYYNRRSLAGSRRTA